MYGRKRIASILSLDILAFLMLVGMVLGQGETVYLDLDLPGGGGGESDAGNYTVTGSVGEPVASSTPSNDGSRYALRDGFWEAQKGYSESTIYLPLVLNRVP